MLNDEYSHRREQEKQEITQRLSAKLSALLFSAVKNLKSQISNQQSQRPL
jgi:hypothetical protein